MSPPDPALSVGQARLALVGARPLPIDAGTVLTTAAFVRMLRLGLAGTPRRECGAASWRWLSQALTTNGRGTLDPAAESSVACVARTSRQLRESLLTLAWSYLQTGRAGQVHPVYPGLARVPARDVAAAARLTEAVAVWQRGVDLVEAVHRAHEAEAGRPRSGKRPRPRAAVQHEIAQVLTALDRALTTAEAAGGGRWLPHGLPGLEPHQTAHAAQGPR